MYSVYMCVCVFFYFLTTSRTLRFEILQLDHDVLKRINVRTYKSKTEL